MIARIADANVPYRLIARDASERTLQYVLEHHDFTNVVLSAVRYRQGARIQTIPISFKAQSTGANSLNLLKIARMGLRAVRDFMTAGNPPLTPTRNRFIKMAETPRRSAVVFALVLSRGSFSHRA